MSFLINLALMFIAGVSAIANYKGLSGSVADQSFWNLLFCGAIAAAVGISIFVFWTVAVDAITKPEKLHRRASSWITTAIGASVILGFSSWWNIAAIGGDEARQAALGGMATDAQVAFSEVQKQAGSFRSALPALSSLSQEIEALADCEAREGCVTGSPGRSGVYETLSQLQDKADAFRNSIQTAERRLEIEFAAGQECLEDLRQSTKVSDADGARTHADCFNASLAAIQSIDIASGVANDLGNFTTGVVIPVSVSSPQQIAAVESILDGLSKRSEAIANGLRSQDTVPTIEPVTIAHMSAMLAVVVHYDQIIPSIVTGIALDLLPLVLLSFLAVLSAARRDRPDAPWHKYTLGEVWEISQMSRLIMGELTKAGENKPANSPVVRTVQFEERELDLPPPMDEWVEIKPKGDDKQDKSE